MEETAMRVIITGGTGFIGRQLAEELLAHGYEVVALSRNPDTANGLPDQVRIERWDARTSMGWGALADAAGLEGGVAIVNLAGENLAGEGFLPARWTDERKARLRDSRINAGKAVVEAVEQATVKPTVVIQSSGIGHYGPRDDTLLTEDDRSGSDFLARLTVDWEASTASVARLGVRHVSIRSAVVLSPDEGALKRLILPFKLFAGGPMGSGKQGFPWIHPADEVGAIRFLLETEAASGPFNLVAPQPMTFAEFGVTLARVMGRPYWLPVPAFALRAALGEVSSTVLEGQRALPKKLLDLGYKFRFPTAEAALRDILRRK
jgi:uncharacterized protein